MKFSERGLRSSGLETKDFAGSGRAVASQSRAHLPFSQFVLQQRRQRRRGGIINFHSRLLYNYDKMPLYYYVNYDRHILLCRRIS